MISAINIYTYESLTISKFKTVESPITDERSIQEYIADHQAKISEDALKLNKSLKIEDKNLNKLVKRIKNSTLPLKNKKLLIRAAWNIARMASAQNESEDTALSNKDFNELMQLVQRMELTTKERANFKQINKDNRKVDKLILGLLKEDKNNKEFKELSKQIKENSEKLKFLFQDEKHSNQTSTHNS